VTKNIQAMYKGTVKFFNPKKGFGFIKEDISGKEVFVHSSDLLDKINEGDSVLFETKRGKKGVTAVEVKLS
jgi:CspA family cold shock protein